MSLVQEAAAEELETTYLVLVPASSSDGDRRFTKPFRRLDDAIYSLSLMNRRLRRLLLPCLFNEIRLSRLGDSSALAKGLAQQHFSLRTLVKTLHIDFYQKGEKGDDPRVLVDAKFPLLLRRLSFITSLIVTRTPTDQSFYEAVAQCKNLKHLTIDCIHASTSELYIPELEELQLESAFFSTNFRVGYGFNTDKKMQYASGTSWAFGEICPIHCILSGKTRDSLKSLTLQSWSDCWDRSRPFGRPKGVMDQINWIIPREVVFTALEELRIGGDIFLGKDASPVGWFDYPLENGHIFPALHTLELVSQGKIRLPANEETQLYSYFPQLRHLRGKFSLDIITTDMAESLLWLYSN